MQQIQSVLIANRGEIAIRIIKTAQKMGITTYGVLTPQEPNAVYLSLVDKVIEPLEEYQTSSKSIFLDPEGIVQLAKCHVIDSIHPGYGFLAENPVLSDMCDKAGILFIGPKASHIRMMGDKNKARQLAVKAGVPVVEGSQYPISSLDDIQKEADRIGYPVIIKAIAGGGGKGMRIVRKSADLSTAYKMAANEAKNAFNNGDMLVEKYLEKPRHIEVQVLSDLHGNAVHLYERECSIQRNHQKLLEEAPSLALNDEKREQITKDALELTLQSGYSTLGTVEFLLDKDGNHFFMEMNTRIQVEHPITEAITRLDLVECQIRTAIGEKLWISQNDITKNGWAIEYRINAENPQAGFAPDFGIIDEMSFPNYPCLRIDSGYIPGSVIPGIYDSLVAKLIIYEKDRASVIKKSASIMQHTNITGVKTTIPFFKALLNHPDFVSGDFDTSFIDCMENMYYQEPNEEEAAAIIALQGYLNEIEKLENDQVVSEEASPWISRMWNKLS